MTAMDAKVKSVHESGEQFQVDLGGDSSIQVRLADHGSSVASRDENGAVECLGGSPPVAAGVFFAQTERFKHE
jgi:hypothetical protein